MDKKQGRKEIIFLMTMAAARKMLERGLATKESYEKLEELMRQKYTPVFGGLFSRLDLI